MASLEFWLVLQKRRVDIETNELANGNGHHIDLLIRVNG